MPKWIAVTIDGVEYPNLTEAWRHESPPGLTAKAVRLRVQRGWDRVVAVLAIPDPNCMMERGLLNKEVRK